jgi:DNA-directed RNA polymerase beta' subunit
MLKVVQFIELWQIFFEKFGRPVYPSLRAEANMISEFQVGNPLLKPPGDLLRWCLRLVISKTALILKNMALELIIVKLREVYENAYLVYTPENSGLIVVRIYFRSGAFKGDVNLAAMEKMKDVILNTNIRGIDGVTNTVVQKMIRHKLAADGGVVRDIDQWGILTSGTNIRDISQNPWIDPLLVQTESIAETARVYGIEAARIRAASEIRSVVDVCNYRHYMAYADEMTFTGRVTSISNTGVKARDPDNILLRTGYSGPIRVLEEAALNAVENTISGVTARYMIGDTAQIGTLYNKFHVNEQFVRANVVRADDYLEGL